MAAPVIYELGELGASEIIEDIAASELYSSATSITDKLYKGYLGLTGAAVAAEYPFKIQDRGKRKRTPFSDYYSVKRRKSPWFYTSLKNNKVKRKKLVKMAPYITSRRINTGPRLVAKPKGYTIRKSYRRKPRIGKYGAKHKSRSSNTIIERPIRGSMRMLQVNRTAFGSQTTGVDNPRSIKYNIFGGGTGGTSGGFGFTFSLDQIGSYTDFTAVFQYYKIVQVEIHFIPRQDTYPSLTNAQTQTARANGNDQTTGANYAPVSECPYVIVACDNGSGSAFSSESDAFAHEGSSIHFFNNGRAHTTRFSPTVLRLAGTAGSEATSYVPKRMWISTSDSSEKHYGLRGYAGSFVSGSSVDVLLKYKVVFKDLKT